MRAAQTTYVGEQKKIANHQKTNLKTLDVVNESSDPNILKTI